MVVTVSAEGTEFFDRIADYMDDVDCSRVRDAWLYAAEKHAGQMRKSGEPYLTHPTSVAYYLAEYQLDADALIAALLHDVAEDTQATVSEIESLFGKDVALMVDAVTKFKKSAENPLHDSLTPEQTHVKTVGKILYSMTRDVRVAVIKLFDRLHNMRTIGSMPQHKKERIANETLELYAPLANRLGMWQVKNELEQRSLQITNLDAYNNLSQQLQKRIRASRTLVSQVCARVTHQLREAGVDVVRVEPSPRNVYTIYQKHLLDESPTIVDQVPRLLIVVRDRIACYTGIGVLHQTWSPIPGGFDDYIARPRENLYRALHTTVRHERGNLLKFRLRTETMAVISEIGVLGRWADMGLNVFEEMSGEMQEQVQALFNNIDRNIEGDADDSGVNSVLEDLLTPQITAYTPKGAPIELPSGATALDFAYKIHTELGHRTHGIQVNGRAAPLNRPLFDGDTVTVLKRAFSPQRLWLDRDMGFLHTAYARGAVLKVFRRQPETIARRQGRALLEAELDMLGMIDFPIDTITEWLGFESPEQLYYAMGRADVLSTDVARRILAQAWLDGKRRVVAREVISAENETFIILGASDVHEALHLCQACRPRPGDEIRGFIRKNKRVTVHRMNCHQLASPHLAVRRLLGLHWGEESSGEVRDTSIQIDIYDRPNLIYEITEMLHLEHINITYLFTHRLNDRTRVDFSIEVVSPRQLVSLLHRFNSLVNVRSVRCIDSFED